MSIATEISRLQTAKANIKSSIEAKGVSVPSNAKLDTYHNYIANIPTSSGVSSWVDNFYTNVNQSNTLLYGNNVTAQTYSLSNNLANGTYNIHVILTGKSMLANQIGGATMNTTNAITYARYYTFYNVVVSNGSGSQTGTNTINVSGIGSFDSGAFKIALSISSSNSITLTPTITTTTTNSYASYAQIFVAKIIIEKVS